MCGIITHKGAFADARLKEERWRAALRIVAGLRGEHLEDG